MQAGPLQPSGRVIAGGRLLLACLFLVAVWTESSQPTPAHGAAYALLIAYAVWSIGVTLFVWHNWWNDARLAAPAHVIDVTVFMIMLYTTEGYASPYYTFFIFILLAAAIRWGWRETAITAAAIIAVYFAVGLLLGDAARFESERFIVRTGQLFIISAILVWFGANHWVAWPRFRLAGHDAGPPDGNTFDAALRAGMAAVGANRGLLLWREPADQNLAVVQVPAGALHVTALPELPGALLFDVRKDRVLMRADASRWRFLRASSALPPGFPDLVGDGTGLAVPIAGGTIEGLVIFEDVSMLSTDLLDIAPQLSRDMAARLQETALFASAEERSMAKARVAVARDLHDSVVQFLAGLGFQLEALTRSPEAVGAVSKTLTELKEAVMTEQRHLRAFIRGLKTGGPVSLRTLSRDCDSLCDLLARQWSIECAFAGMSGPGSVPMSTQLDVHHLVREAVANAARHGQASLVRVSLSREDGGIRLTVEDDGSGFAAGTDAGGELAAPASLGGRVREAGGEIGVTSTPGGTKVVIRLPVESSP
jgi:signal transduction histidine kinase